MAAIAWSREGAPRAASPDTPSALNRPARCRTVDGWHSSSAAISAGASPCGDSGTITARSPCRHGPRNCCPAARSGGDGCW